MSGLNDFGRMLKQKKAKKLFWGMLGPLLIVTISACSFFYYVSNAILKEYMKSQLELSVEKLNTTVSDSMEPIIINVDNFVSFSADYNDEEKTLDSNVVDIIAEEPQKQETKEETTETKNEKVKVPDTGMNGYLFVCIGMVAILIGAYILIKKRLEENINNKN